MRSPRRLVARALLAWALSLWACAASARPASPPPAPLAPPPQAPARDEDHDGLAAEQDLCPSEPEDRDGFQDEDGCPDPDNDHDGIPDVADACPNEAETLNGFQDADGCPDRGPPHGPLRPALAVFRLLRFAPGSARLDAASRSLLAQVAVLLRAEGPVRRLSLDGRASAREREPEALALRRAESVRSALLALGASPSQLEPRGWAARCPPSSAEDTRADLCARSVSFEVLDPPQERADEAPLARPGGPSSRCPASPLPEMLLRLCRAR